MLLSSFKGHTTGQYVVCKMFFTRATADDNGPHFRDQLYSLIRCVIPAVDITNHMQMIMVYIEHFD